MRENNGTILRRARSNSEVDGLLSIVGHNILSTLQRQTNDFINNLDLQNVPVIPTQRQIELGTHIIPFNNIINPQNTICPISLTRFEEDTSLNVMRIRYCGHLYVPQELRVWFTHNHRCPLCRYDIRNYSQNSIDSNNVSEEENNEEEENNNEEENNEEENTNIPSYYDNSNNPLHQVFTRTFESNSLDDLTNQLTEAFNTSFNLNDISLNNDHFFGENFSIELEGLVETPDVSNS